MLGLTPNNVKLTARRDLPDDFSARAVVIALEEVRLMLTVNLCDDAGSDDVFFAVVVNQMSHT